MQFSRCDESLSGLQNDTVNFVNKLRFCLELSFLLLTFELFALGPAGLARLSISLIQAFDLGYGGISQPSCLPRKEVIQPHLPIRLPCYDFTPVIGLTFGGCSLRWLTDFGYSQLPWCDGRCVQGPGTYSPRRSDSRLLATPTSCGRVAAHSPN